MTTEPRPVVLGMEDLRECLAGCLWNQRSHSFGWHELSRQEQRQEMHEAEAILDTIEAAGLSIVATDRVERLVAAVRVFADNRVVGPSGDVGSVAELLLRPGDLDPLAGGDR